MPNAGPASGETQMLHIAVFVAGVGRAHRYIYFCYVMSWLVMIRNHVCTHKPQYWHGASNAAQQLCS